jgi:iron complex transport system substrate-binding protein
LAAVIRAVALSVAALMLSAGAVRAAVSVTDDDGNLIALDAPARRIVSLAPHATELLYAAGAGDRVVGVLSTSDWPPEAATKPKVGDVHRLDMERIIGLAPDLVVTWPYLVPAQVAILRARGVPVFMTRPTTIAGIADDIERLGVLAGTRAVATARAKAFRAELARLSAQRTDRRTVRVFYEIWNEPLYTVGGKHLITEGIRACGGDNVFASLTLPAPGVSVEAVLAAKPEAIIAGADGAVRPAWLDDWKRWTMLPAVAAGNLYTVDANLLHRPGPRFLDGVADLCAALDAARARRR